MKILVFSLAYQPFIGGAEIALAEIIERLPQHQFDIITVNLDGKQASIEKKDHVTIHRLGSSWIGKYFFPVSAFLYALRLQYQQPFDLAWSMMANQAGLAALFFKWRFPQVQYLLTLQEGDSERAIWVRTWFIRPLYKMIYRHADAIQAISHYLAQRAQKMGYCGRIEIIGNGVSDAFFAESAAYSEKTIISISRLVEKNGIEYLIRAMATVDAKLILIGDGVLRNRLEQLSKELGLSEKITFLGSVPNEQLPAYLAKADVFVRPSLSEGFGISFLEAMAMKVPVIATSVGGIVDFVHDKETGWLVASKNSDELSHKIKYVLSSAQSDEVVGVVEAAYKLAYNKYRWSFITEKIDRVFTEIHATRLRLVLATGIYPPDIGGPATYAKLLHDYLPSRGVAVSILSFGEVRNLPKGIRHMVYVWRLFWLSLQHDVIFAQDTISVGLPAAAISAILRKKLVIRVPGDYAWEQSRQRFGVKDDIDDFQKKSYQWQVELLRRLQSLAVRQAQVVITPSIYFKNLVGGWMEDAQKVHHIYNGISFTELDTVIGDTHIVSDQRLMVSVGRLVPWKGFETLIRTMGQLPEWKLAIIGDGPDFHKLQTLISQLHLEHRVKLYGALPRLEMAKVMRSAAVFVLNTRFESFSFQIVEAMYLGMPVIATRIGNIPEIIEDGQTGILIEPDDTCAIKLAIEKISQDTTWRNQIVVAARQKAQEFSIQTTIDSLLKFFH